MSGPKLEYARHAAADLVRRLRPEDVVSVVTYDDEVTTVAEPNTGSAQRDLPGEIERIQSGGSTNLSGGWLRGRELVSRNGATPTATTSRIRTRRRACSRRKLRGFLALPHKTSR